MSVASWLRSLFTTQDPATYKSAIDGNFAVLERVGAMFACQQAAVPNMTVVIRAGSIMDAGSLIEVARQTSGTITAPASLSRIDRIVLDQRTGAYSVVTGTPGVTPSPPAIPAGAMPCAQILLVSTSTAITNSMITDERVFCSTSKAYQDSIIASVAIPAGSRTVWNQTAAPTGWTKDTSVSLNDSILRIVTGAVGSGGSVAFSSFNSQTATAAYTLTTTDMPSHFHANSLNDSGHAHAMTIGFRWGGTNVSYPGVYDSGGTGTSAGAVSAATTGMSINNASAGGGGAHSHGITTSIKYNDFIVATKN